MAFKGQKNRIKSADGTNVHLKYVSSVDIKNIDSCLEIVV